MSLEALSTVKGLIETELLGSTVLFGLGCIMLIWILLSLIRVPQKVNLLIIAPMIISLSVWGILPGWILGLIGIFIGLALAVIILRIYT